MATHCVRWRHLCGIRIAGAEVGASLIEFALVLPLFLALIFGILYFGIVFATQQAVNYAAERAAESVVNIDPRLDPSAYSAQASKRVNTSIGAILGFFPGEVPRVLLATDCDAASPQPADTENSVLCIQDDAGGERRRVVIVRLAPAFKSLWPGFPEIGYARPALIRATGRVVLDRGMVISDAGT